MAQTTRTLALIKSAYADEASPNTVFPTNSSTEYLVSPPSNGRQKCLVFGFDSWPSNLRRNIIYSARVYLYCKDGAKALTIKACNGDFNPASVTYNNLPAAGSASGDISGHGASPDLPGSWENRSAAFTQSSGAQNLVINHGVTVKGYYWRSDYPGEQWSAKTVLSNGTAPYIEVTYDSSDTIAFSISSVSGLSGTVNPQQAATVAYYVHKSSSYSAYDESWTQASAKLFWRVSGASSWNQVSKSGSSQSIPVPANTFPAGNTIQFYVQSTESDGSTAVSSTSTFTTPSPQITLSSYPSGTNFDTRSSLQFTWDFIGNGWSFPQSSATLYWKKSTANAWNSIAASGSTKGVTVAANTFPTGATVQFYVSGTSSGITSSTSTLSFQTVTTAIKTVQAPSGSNIYTGGGLLFKWKYESAVGDYSQSAAILYWKKDSENNYHSISVSGNTQQLTVAANTFPTNATVQWYLRGTDSGGYVSETSVSSFKTLTSKITVQNSPVSGYSDPRNATTFQWYFATNGGPVAQSSATLYWKTSTAGSYTAVAASGSTTGVTVAANTFPVASIIQWYVAGTDAGGTSSQSPVYSFSTTAGTAYAYCQSPVGTAEDGSKPITLSWMLVTEDGSTPSKVTLSWKTPNDVSWTVIRQSTTAFSSWTVDEEFFPVGEIEWRVVATNRDNVDGPAGIAAFICLRAPDPAEGLRATAVPITTVSWQSAAQEAYEISIDGAVVQTAFGPGVNSWTVPQPLADGIHTIQVRIQGTYGLWSDPAETSIDVVNDSPVSDFTIDGIFGTDAELLVEGAETEDLISWFRDGKLIARTQEKSFTDRFALGEHQYYAEIWYSSGNYARTEAITGKLQSCVTRIALLDGGPWLELPLAESSSSVQTFRHRQSASTRHVLGAAYPVLEMTEFRDLSGSYLCAFKDPAGAAELEAMLGKAVILKSRGGCVVTGALTEISRQMKDFYITCSFSIEQIEWEDFVDGVNV